MIARVEPLTRTRALRGPFDYRLAPEHDGVRVGSLLRVPFSGRAVLAVVTELARTSELAPERLAEPEAVMPTGIPPDLVELAGWIAHEYCSTPARALGLMLAPGAATGVARRRLLTAELTAAGHAARRDGTRLTDAQRALLSELERSGPAVAARLGTEALRRLERRGLVTLEPRAQRRRPAAAPVGARHDPQTLTGDQRRALDEVLAALEARHGQLLLHGVTGSGKTEVYLQAVQATLARGRGAIVLVPEIALTPQTMTRFQQRFGDVVAVLHSALGAGERHDEWLALAGGEALVCVGPRSAVFAPLPDIGLIVVDEEHDGSYKHEGDPRYDARTVALERARRHGAVVLAGSATPRPESAVALRRLRLPRRVDGRPLPPVEVLDMRGAHHPLHPRTRTALADVRRAGGKAIVLLNRRGWSNFLSCRDCGHVWMCPNCEVALVLHRAGASVSCHHCGHRERIPARCPECGSVAVARHGAGTERLEHELREALGQSGFPVFRLDADVVAGKDRVADTLAQFSDARSGLLVGTQMVAKGHDFPDVTLGVVLDADQTLRFPDFRAEERTFALVTQLAGRAGRGDAGGTVLVQTLAPAARSIQFAARHDADGFLEQELRVRRALGYPPFGTLIRVVCAAADAAAALELAGRVRAGIELPDTIVLGPAPLFRLRGKARSQLVVKTSAREAAIATVGAAVEGQAVRASRAGVSLSVDVDPQ
ncbi:MAG TPA: primosomal protein N' [Solirubrobacteraceae bacterium]|nr:primosomal protein N' [Solirubrobacteraceae bacterium]